MIKKVFAKVKKIVSDKKKMLFPSGMANKKLIMIGATAVAIFVMVGIVVVAAHCETERHSFLNKNKNGHMLKNYSVGQSSDSFVLPEDAAKSGELAIVVSDIDSAKTDIQGIATKNGGVVYSSYMAYASENIKNGSVVVQIPSANFDAAFSDLKKIGKQVIQESIKQIPTRNSIIYPQPAAESQIAKDSVANRADEIAIAPVPTYPQAVQNKGYIKIIFADYNNRKSINVGSILGVGYQGQNMRDNMWVVLAIKSIVLVVLIAIIVIVAKRIITNLQKIKRINHVAKPAVKHVVHIVKRATKTKKRVAKATVKTKKK